MTMYIDRRIYFRVMANLTAHFSGEIVITDGTGYLQIQLNSYKQMYQNAKYFAIIVIIVIMQTLILVPIVAVPSPLLES